MFNNVLFTGKFQILPQILKQTYKQTYVLQLILRTIYKDNYMLIHSHTLTYTKALAKTNNH